jgi:hypothetical protein
MPGRDALLHEARHGRQGQRGLGNVALGGFQQLEPERLDLFPGRARPHQHPVAARAVDLLHDQLTQVVEHVFQLVRLAALPCGHVVQDRLLAQVEADHVGDIGVDRLVVRHPRAGRGGQRHPARAVDVHEPGDAQHRIGPETERVEEGVVDPAIDHVDLPRALRRTHPDEIAFDEEVRRLDQFHPHHVGQEGVLIVGRIEMPRRQDHHARIAVAFLRRHALQRAAQQRGIVLHGRDALLLEQLREHPHHDLAVLEHVGDARGRAAIVLEHEELVRPGAHEVDADDVAIDAPRRADVHHLPLEGLVAVDEPRGHTAGADDLAPRVDVVEKGVERAGALLDAPVELAPFVGREGAREHVKGDQPVGVAALAVDGEGDADAAEQRLGLGLLETAQLARHLVRPAVEPPVGRTHRGALIHLVEIVRISRVHGES